jgi:hypothetical protein
MGPTLNLQPRRGQESIGAVIVRSVVRCSRCTAAIQGPTDISILRLLRQQQEYVEPRSKRCFG